MRNVLVGLLGLAALGWTAHLATVSPVMAQTGQVTGTLEGEPLDFTVSDGVGGMPGLFYETYGGSGYSGLGIIASALEQSDDSIDGVMLFMDFESEGSVSPADMTADMVADAVIMVVEAWDAGSQNPERVWLAELDGFQSLEIDRLDLGGDAGALSGRIASDSFCLQDMSSGDPEPIVQDNAEICRAGTVNFTMVSGDATTAPPEQPMQIEELGRVTGMIGRDTYEWITFLADGAQATASIDRAGVFDMLNIQAHSSDSDDFLRADILTVTVAGDFATGEIINDGTVPVNVSFFPDGIGSHYTSEIDGGEVSASVSSFTHDSDQGEIEMSLEGRLCRVEDFAPVEGDCKTFELEVMTKLLRAQGG
ncbi:hypothetical protein M8756_08610 [Lutimaribacter sp. EGI FJ00015]|uniref:Uncharacterized protein n=1 Tax=Lutimaribacter degradans TaxID=2945989 RepID=A0ACC5ZVU1_9RHOB|nr:hypothetical protein [Lutimaribacter sp. EGI FJ00013]MCM2562215.1 hypothetical protein [Lutimaribacter sp. EGI FJ00013]MCO0613370.1 hypothetical protein [Lutimaribacter sp. EGI FJ00015]MCO0636344.1 hypothetical protein [Lutimaribacter sp. EGI FJ00014]